MRDIPNKIPRVYLQRLLLKLFGRINKVVNNFLFRNRGWNRMNSQVFVNILLRPSSLSLVFVTKFFFRMGISTNKYNNHIRFRATPLEHKSNLQTPKIPDFFLSYHCNILYFLDINIWWLSLSHLFISFFVSNTGLRCFSISSLKNL